MKRKKVLSMAVVSALIAAQMAMPVMAADGGSLDVEVTTQSGVLRVEVPTTMSIAVDQFEIGNEGAQIAVAAPFSMVNKSEMNVRVDVTSTADLGTGISLVSSKAAAGSSTKNEAWLAVAAQVAANKYDSATTDPKDAWDLADTDANVATFGSDKKAKQTFYLEKATGTVSYKLAVPDANGKVGESFAKFYELEEIDTSTGTPADILTAAAATADLYTVATGAADKTALTVIPQGTTIKASGATGTNEVDIVSGNTYYKAATTASTPVTGKVYAYASLTSAGTDGEAAFTYIGKLSNAKETWTADDIKKISIAYTITGVTETKYNEVKDDCTYGLYEAPAPTVPTITETSASGTNNVIHYAVPTGVAVDKVEVVKSTGTTTLTNATHYTIDTAAGTITMLEAVLNGNVGNKLKITFNNNPATSIELSIVQ